MPAPLPQTITLPPPVIADQQRRCGIGDRPGQHLGRLELQVGAVEEVLLDALFEHGPAMIVLRAGVAVGRGRNGNGPPAAPPPSRVGRRPVRFSVPAGAGSRAANVR